MKPYFFLMILRAAALFLSALMLLSCGGDGDPDRERPHFEGWERPVFPLETHAETHESVSEKAPETAPTEEKTEQKDASQDTEAQIPFDPSFPSLHVGEPLTAPNEMGHLYPVLISDLPEGGPCALLMLLKTVGGEEIYAVTPGDMCAHMNFHYIYDDGFLAVLIDGDFKQAKENISGILLYASVKSDGGVAPELVVHAYEYATS